MPYTPRKIEKPLRVSWAPLTIDTTALSWLLDISPTAVLNAIHSGQLPAIKAGRCWRFHPGDVLAALGGTK